MSIIDRLFNKQINRRVDAQVSNIAQQLGTQFDSLQATLAERFQLLGGAALYRASSPMGYIQEGYAGNADVYAIIRLIAKTAAMVPLFVYEVRDQKAYRKFRQLNTKTYDAMFMDQYYDLHTKALEIVGENDELQMLLDRPNDIDEKQEFYTGVYGYHLLDGNSFIYAPAVPEGANAGKITGLYMMPPQYTTIISSNTFPRIIFGYRVDVNGVNLVDSTDVLHMKYWNPEFSYDGQELIGLSPLRAMLKTLYRSNSAKDNSVAQFQHGGPPAILGNKNIQADQAGLEITSKLRERWAKEREGSKNAGKWLLSPGEPVFIRTGLTPVELDILESERFTLAQLANGYGISDVLLNNHQSSTESNVKEMRKALYTNAALPEVYALRDLLNKGIVPKFQKGGVRKVIDCDITGISELQPDYKAMADTFAALPIMIPNNIMEAFKYGKQPDPNMDKVYVKQGYQLLEDLNIQAEPLPNDPAGNNEKL